MRHPISKVGSTRSGQAIVMFFTDDEEFIARTFNELTLEDHFDAWAVFQRLMIRSKRKLGEETDEYARYRDSTERHRSYLTQEFVATEMQRLSLATSIDLVRFAAPLTEHIFVDDRT